MTVIIVLLTDNRYRFETIDGTTIGPNFTAVYRADFLTKLTSFRKDTLKGAFSWNTPTSSLTAARIAAAPVRPR